MENKKQNKVLIVIFWVISIIFLFAAILALIRIQYGNAPQFITYTLATIFTCPIIWDVIQKRTNKNIKWYLRIIPAVLIIAIGCLFFGNNEEVIKNKVLTADNYEKVMSEWKEVLGENDKDEVYYFTYSNMYYLISDGVSSMFNTNTNQNSKIYGKTIKQLIKEGKKLMEEHEITIEEFKLQVKQSRNTIF